MQIDWFTVGAQVVNFLILIWLMKRFLYKPILHAIDEREKRIAAELADAATKESEAQKERDKFQQKNEEFEKHRDSLLSQATDEVDAERQRLLREAREAVDLLRSKHEETLEREQKNLHDEITRRAQDEVFAIARKTLTDLSGASLEERMAQVFTERLRQLKGEEKTALFEAVKSVSEPLLVRTAFELSLEQQTMIHHKINQTFSAELQVKFQTVPDVISGIELTANGHKVAWSIADYLESLQKSVTELLQQKPKVESESEKHSERLSRSQTKSTPATEAK